MTNGHHVQASQPIPDANATIFVGGISKGQSYRDLIAWQKAMALVTDVYLATRRFPGEERYGLTNQLRRAAVLIPSKIAEGQARFSASEGYHFLSMARGSLVEVETHVQIALNLGYPSDIEGSGLMEETSQLGRILNGPARVA